MPARVLFLLLPSLILPSLAPFHKYVGAPGVLLYVCGALLVLPPAINVVCRRLPCVSTRAAYVLSGAILAAMLALFVIVYPLAQHGSFGPGSDGDDALNVSIAELLEGHYPYYRKTYLNNSISPMPGSLLLATPFYLLFGNAAYQNIFWLCALCALVIVRTREPRAGLLILLLLVVGLPAFVYRYVVGTDYATNAIFVLALMQLLLLTKSRSFAANGFAALLGVALSSRANFLFLLPLAFSALWQRSGWTDAVQKTAVVGVTAAGVTLPFLLYDVAHFTPLQTSRKLRLANDVLPHGDVWILVLCAVVVLCLSLQRSNRTDAGLFRNGALVLMVAPLSLFVLELIRIGLAACALLTFGLFFAVFGIYSAVVELADAASKSSA